MSAAQSAGMSTKAKFLIACLLAATIAVIYISVRSPTAVNASLMADDTDQVVPSIDAVSQALAESTGTELTPVEELSEPVVDVSRDSTQEPIKLYSEPNPNDLSYRDARDIATTYMSQTRESWSRNFIFKTDSEAIDELLRQVESSQDGLQGSFDLSPYSDVPCVLSSINHTIPSFQPGIDEAPERYLILGRCDSSTRTAQISIIKSENSFRLSLTSPSDVYSVRQLGDSGYSLAYRNDFASIPPVDTPAVP